MGFFWTGSSTLPRLHQAIMKPPLLGGFSFERVGRWGSVAWLRGGLSFHKEKRPYFDYRASLAGDLCGARYPASQPRQHVWSRDGFLGADTLRTAVRTAERTYATHTVQ